MFINGISALEGRESVGDDECPGEENMETIKKGIWESGSEVCSKLMTPLLVCDFLAKNNTVIKPQAPCYFVLFLKLKNGRQAFWHNK